MKHDAERVPYGKVARRIWRDAKFRALGKDARLLFLYLLTAPDMRGVGILVGCPVSIRADLPELGIRRIRAALRELVGADLVEWYELDSLLLGLTP